MHEMNPAPGDSPEPSPAPPPPPLTPIGENMRISVCCNQGGRKYMEDRVSIHCEFTEDGRVDYIFTGVFDGHGGADASSFAKQHLRHNIVKQIGFNSSQDSEVLEAIRIGFIETHEAMRQVVDGWPRTASGFTSTSGTTASVAFIRRGKLFIGHVGDSGIVMGSQASTGELVGSSLTVEHKPDSPEEKKRIEDIGGEIMNKSGVMRVVWVRPLRGHQGPVRRSTPKEKIPFLAVARALGDLWSYNSDANAFVVSPEPDVSMVELDSSNCCLIFGSDGLWNVLRPQHAVDIVNSHEWKEEELNWMANQGEGYETNHARWIVRHALMRWGSLRADNISVITIILGNRVVSGSSYAKRVEPSITSIEDILTSDPSSIIKVSPDGVIAIPSKPVELVYYGVNEAVATYFSGGYLSGGSTISNEYHRIPGYTNYERGPPFGSLLSTVTSSSLMTRYPVQDPPASRYFHLSSVVTNPWQFPSQRNSDRGNENSAFIRPSVAPSAVNESNTNGAPPLPVTEEEPASELEVEPHQGQVDLPTESSQSNNPITTTTPTAAPTTNTMDDLENGYGNRRVFLFSGANPCASHGVASCCLCSLARAPLSQWTATASTNDTTSQTYGTDTPPVEMAGMDMQLLRLSPKEPTSIVNTTALFRYKRAVKQRRTGQNPSPHIYNTRLSCRTTRSGTKLSPQKVLFNKTPTLAIDSSKQRRRMTLATTSTRRRPFTASSTPSSTRSRRFTSFIQSNAETKN